MINFHIERKIKNETVIDNIVYNMCGKPIKNNSYSKCGDSIFDDHLEIRKLWGYESIKDGEEDNFEICEDCYDKWISTFKIPIKKVII